MALHARTTGRLLLVLGSLLSVSMARAQELSEARHPAGEAIEGMPPPRAHSTRAPSTRAITPRATAVLEQGGDAIVDTLPRPLIRRVGLRFGVDDPGASARRTDEGLAARLRHGDELHRFRLRLRPDDSVHQVRFERSAPTDGGRRIERVTVHPDEGTFHVSQSEPAPRTRGKPPRPARNRHLVDGERMILDLDRLVPELPRTGIPTMFRQKDDLRGLGEGRTVLRRAHQKRGMGRVPVVVTRETEQRRRLLGTRRPAYFLHIGHERYQISERAAAAVKRYRARPPK